MATQSKLVKVVKAPKSSLADRPASLEVDTAGGRLVGKTEVGHLHAIQPFGYSHNLRRGMRTCHNVCLTTSLAPSSY